MTYHTNGTGRPPPPGLGKRLQNRVTITGFVVLLVGVIFAVRTYITLVDLDNQLAERSSFITRVLPGFIANPARFLNAVNGGGTSSANGPDPLLAQLKVNSKADMDRWMALVCLGGTLVAFGIATPTGRVIRGPSAPPHSTIAADIAPVLLILALSYVMLSFFEIP
jgi:hypothetical protein